METILVVEGDPTIAELERRNLEDAGYAVSIATTAEDAVAKVTEDGVALVVVDHVLPGGVSGITLYERLKEAGHDLPVVMVARQGDEETVTRAMRAGVRHYAVKSPEHLGFLPEVVGRALSQARTERLLEESEERFRALTEAAFEAVVISEDGEILEASRAFAEMFGYGPRETVGEPVWKFVAPESVDLVRRAVSSASEEPYEATGLRRDGTRFDVEVRGRRSVYRGRAVRVSAIRDVTGRKRAEERLREAEARYRTLVEQVPAVTYTDRADGSDEPLYVSPQIEQMLGYTPEEWIGEKMWPKRLHPNDRERVLTADERFESGEEEPFGEEYRLLAKDGSVVWVREEAVLVRDGDGKPLFWQGVLFDTTERKRFEESLKESEERFRSLVQNSSDIIGIVGADGVTRYVSPSIKRVLGYEAEGRIGESALDLVHPEDVGMVRGLLAGLLAEPGASVTAEFRMLRADGAVVHAEAIGTNRIDEPGVGGVVVNYRDVTGRKEADRALRESELRLRTIVENTPVVLFALDAEGVITVSEGRGLGGLGRAQTEMVGRSVFEAYADNSFIVEHARRALAGEAMVKTVDIHGIALEVRCSPVRGETGGISGVIGVAMDVTERKRTEEVLRESEARFRSLVLNTSDIIAIIDTDGTKQYVAPSSHNVLGYGTEEWLGRNILEDIHPDDAEGAATVLAELLEDAGGTTPPMELRIRHKDGSWRHVEKVVTNLLNVPGIEGLVVNARDITERRRAEKELRLRDRAIEASANGIILTDPNAPDNPMVYINPAFERMSGYPARELVGRNCRMLQGSDRDQPALKELRAAVSEGREYRGILRNYRKDGTLFFNELHIAPVFDQGGRLVNFVGVMTDVTEREGAEREMREANRRLTELAALRADFTAMVAHELDTPLAVIRGYADVLATGELGPAERDRALERIQSETDVLNALIEDVRVSAVAEREDFAVNPRPVRVGALLEDAARFAHTLPGGHALVVEGARDGRKVWADQYRIGQVLRNLLSNAARYSPDGTPIQLRAVPGIPGGDPGRVRVEVADNGPGVHPDDAARVFEKFGRGRDQDGRQVAGLGLGLYLSKRIVEAHGGELTMEAAPEGGSVFGFELALAEVTR